MCLVAVGLFGPGTAVAQDGAAPVTLVVDPGSVTGTVNGDLIGFNWREGGEAVAPLEPRLVRMWSVDFSKITPAAGVYDWSLPDAHVAAIRSTGATPLIVLVGRPPWSPDAGSDGYRQAVEAAMIRYGVEQRPAGARPTWFESGNEPEFPPTSHGQLIHDVPLDAAAQAAAVLAVEAAGGEIVWGGPGALFADAVTIEMFALAGEAAGRTPDYLSWHSYTNQPLLGPDGSEFHDPASATAYEALRGTNPVATPRIIGLSSQLVQVMAQPFTAPDGEPPDAVITEWHLSSGGLDHRHDTAAGAAHTAGGLIELQTSGAGAGAFFAAADRHCEQPADEPDPYCGDWGTATADGVRKPVWWVFDWWRELAGSSVVAVDGAVPEEGVWALGTTDANVVRVLVASFSVAQPTDREVTIELGAGVASAGVEVVRGSGPAAPERLALDPGRVSFLLPADHAALVELTMAAAPVGGDAGGPAAGPRGELPATGGDAPRELVALLAIAVMTLRGAAGVSRARRR